MGQDIQYDACCLKLNVSNSLEKRNDGVGGLASSDQSIKHQHGNQWLVSDQRATKT